MAWNPNYTIPAGPEALMAAVLAVLTRDLPAALAWADPDLVEPAEMAAVLPDRKNFPSIEIQWLETTYEPDMDVDYEDSQESSVPVHRIQIDLALSHYDPVELHGRWFRYSKAIRSILANATPADTNYSTWRVTGEQLLEAGILQNRGSIHIRRGLISMESRN